MLLDMIWRKENKVMNEYSRVVRYDGNPRAMSAIKDVFEPCDVEWRGFPKIPDSGLRLRKKFSEYDARERFKIKVKKTKKHDNCMCGNVLKGKISPEGCRLFAKACSPRHPLGPCMVSKEGACGIAYRYRNDREN
jgi:hydrogenase expression/formation protein HypD